MPDNQESKELEEQKGGDLSGKVEILETKLAVFKGVIEAQKLNYESVKRQLTATQQALDCAVEALKDVHKHYIEWAGFCPIRHKKVKDLLHDISKNR